VELTRKNASPNSPTASGMELARNNASSNSSAASGMESTRSNDSSNSSAASGSSKLSFAASRIEFTRESSITI